MKSNLDRVRDELLSEAPVSRLNYRDESSGPIQTGGDTTFGKHWNTNKSNKQKLNRKQRKKVRPPDSVQNSLTEYGKPSYLNFLGDKKRNPHYDIINRTC